MGSTARGMYLLILMLLGHVSSDSDVVAEVLYTVFVLTMMLKVISSKGQEVCCRDAVHYLIFYFWKPFCSDILLWQHLL